MKSYVRCLAAMGIAGGMALFDVGAGRIDRHAHSGKEDMGEKVGSFARDRLF